MVRSFFSALLCGLLFTTTNAQFLEWARSIDSSGQEIAFATAADTEGSVITVGSIAFTVDLDPGAGVSMVSSNGSSDAFVQKLDADGAFVWGYAFGAGGADQALGVATDANNNVLITGKVSGTVDLDPTAGVFMATSLNTGFDVFVISLSSAGVFQWAKLFGGNSNDAGTSIATTANGSIITTGYFGFNGDIDPGPSVVTVGGNGAQDVFVQQLDASGTFVWGQAIGGMGNDSGHGCAVDATGNIFITGEYQVSMDADAGAGVTTLTSAGSTDMFALKLSALGVLQWAHGFGGTSSERARSVAVGPDGGPVYTGRITSPTDFDPGPGTLILPGSGTEDAFVLKLTASGDLVFAFLLKSFLNEGSGVAVDAQNNIYACGEFGALSSNPLDLDPGPGSTLLVDNGGSDAYLASYTATGTFRWGFGVGSAQNDVPHGIALTPTKRIIIVGEFRQTVDMDPGPGVTLLTSAGGQDAFTAVYNKPDCEGVFVDARAILSGAYEQGGFSVMYDDLRIADLIPLAEPYTAMGFVLDEPATTTEQALDWTLSAAIVDWVLLELRDATDPTDIVARKAALLRRDGKIVAVDGVATVGFCVPHGDYYVVVRHRNHLGVMTAAPIALSAAPTMVDLTDPTTPVYGTDARAQLNDVMGLWQGNVTPNTEVKYTGTENDRDPILARIGGVVPTNSVVGYWPEDVNLDGVVRYTGVNNDRDQVLLVIGGVVPTATRAEQLP
ncbi:MAG: hypothetical protein KA408_00320 [Flavobacteriales bacterium]|nr:hypothetical protein [Flavobacteriales bacterium]